MDCSVLSTKFFIMLVSVLSFNFLFFSVNDFNLVWDKFIAPRKISVVDLSFDHLGITYY